MKKLKLVKRMSNQLLSLKLKSFTLVESLVVLLIVSVLMLIGGHQWHHLKGELIEENFIRQFEANYLETQKHAILYEINSVISFENNQLRFYQMKGGRPHYSRQLLFPDTIQGVEVPYELSFIAVSGRTSQVSRYEFYLKKKREIITYQLQMGSGKYLKRVVKK